MKARCGERPSAALFLPLALLFCVTATREVAAVGRATPEQMREMAEDSEALLENPVDNLDKISACLIRPGTIDQETLLARFRKDLKGTREPVTRAALYYLIGEAHYWGTLAQVRRTKSKDALKDCGQRVVPCYLEAWDALGVAEKKADRDRVRTAVRSRLQQLTNTDLFGASLSGELKTEVVSRFIDPLERSKEDSDAWSLEKKAKAYRNLGIAERLASLIPKEVPDNLQKALDAMKLAWWLGNKTEALRFAYAVEEKHGPVIEKDPAAVQSLCEIYRVCCPPRALALLKKIAPENPEAYIAVYTLSPEAESSLEMKERRKYLEAYLSGVTSEGNVEALPFLVAAERCIEAKDYDGGLSFSQRGLQVPVSPANEHHARLWYTLGCCYANLKEAAKAREAYKHCRELAPGVSGGARLEGLCAKGLSAIADTDQKGD